MTVLLENDDYKIREEFDDNGNRYLLCVPNDQALEYQLCFSLNEDILAPGDMLLKASNIYATILKKKKNLLYVHMILDAGELTDAASDNDSHLYGILFKKITSIYQHTKELFFNEMAGIRTDKVEMICQGDDDAKFIDWIEINNTLPVERVNINNDISQYVDIFDPQIPFIDDSDKNDQNVSVKTWEQPAISHGYSNVILMIITLAIVLVIGIGVAYLLIK